MESYKQYKENVLKKISEAAREINGPFDKGVYKYGGQLKEYSHILPLPNNENTPSNRRKSIKKYLNIEIDEFIPSGDKNKKEELHTYVHHLNSSQLLGYSTFRPFLDNEKHPSEVLIKLLNKFSLNISKNAICQFEYKDDMIWKEENKSEGTSFDFFISDENRNIYFEFKFTEDGFAKAKNDNHHNKKIKELYLPKIKQYDLKIIPDIDEVREFYQLFRNIIRTTENDIIIFITDNNNPSTKRDLENFKKFFKTDSKDNHQICKNIFSITWQDVKDNLSSKLLPFQFNCF